MDPFLVDDDRWLLVHVPTMRIFCPPDPQHGNVTVFVYRSEADAKEFLSLLGSQASSEYVIHRVSSKFLHDFARALLKADPKVGFVSNEEFDERFKVESDIRRYENN